MLRLLKMTRNFKIKVENLSSSEISKFRISSYRISWTKSSTLISYRHFSLSHAYKLSNFFFILPPRSNDADVFYWNFIDALLTNLLCKKCFEFFFVRSCFKGVEVKMFLSWSLLAFFKQLEFHRGLSEFTVNNLEFSLWSSFLRVGKSKSKGEKRNNNQNTIRDKKAEKYLWYQALNA